MLARGTRVLLLAAALATAAPLPAVAQVRPAECATGDWLSSTGEYDKAREKYQAALGTAAGTACGAVGLRSLAVLYEARGQALLAAGQVDAATKAFTAAYELDPDKGKGGLDSVGPQRAVRIARQLKAHGHEDEARTVLLAALRTYPGLTVPEDLAPLARERPARLAWWQAAAERAAPWARTAGELLVVLVVAAILLQFAYSRVHRRLRIGTFTAPAKDGSESKATAVAAEFQGLVRARVQAIASAQTGGRVDLAGAAGGPVAIPATVVGAVQQARLVEAVLQLLTHLVPANDRTLCGTLLGDSARGRGVTVTLDARRGAPRATRTFWVDDLAAAARADATSDSYHPLVDVVAAWTLERFAPRRFRRLGTRDPVSFAMFAAGTRQQERGANDALVRDAFHRALAADPANRPARYNLAVHTRHQGGSPGALADELWDLRQTASRPSAGRRLRHRLAGIRGAQADPLWWQTTFSLAVCLTEQGQQHEAIPIAREGVVAGLRVAARPRWLRNGIAEFAIGTFGSIAVVYAHLCPSTGSPPEEKPNWRSREFRARLKKGHVHQDTVVTVVRDVPEAMTPRTRYNLACYYAAPAPFARPTARDADRAVAELAQALPRLDHELLAWVDRDPSFETVRPAVTALSYAEDMRRAAVRQVRDREVAAHDTARAARNPAPAAGG